MSEALEHPPLHMRIPRRYYTCVSITISSNLLRCSQIDCCDGEQSRNARRKWAKVRKLKSATIKESRILLYRQQKGLCLYCKQPCRLPVEGSVADNGRDNSTLDTSCRRHRAEGARGVISSAAVAHVTCRKALKYYRLPCSKWSDTLSNSSRVLANRGSPGSTRNNPRWRQP